MAISPNDIHDAGIAEVASALRSGVISSIELTEHLLDRIDRYDPALNAFMTITVDLAFEQARRADREMAAGTDRGPLHGVPIAVKDVFDIAGIPTTGGSLLYEDRVPDRDATVVRLLAEAGAVTLGKTGLHELAWGSTSNNPHFGAIANPWRLDHHPGGSSGGSAAAVAAGLAFAALGTDTGCSVRQPAQCCGVVGHKPTFGLVSKAGVVPLARSLDHVGPITRTVRDAAIVLDAIAGFDADDPFSVDAPLRDVLGGLDAPIEGAVIGIPRAYFFDGGEDEVVRVVEETLAVFGDLGARVIDVDLDRADLDAALEAVDALFVEMLAAHGDSWRASPELLSAPIREGLEALAARPAAEYEAAHRFRRGFRERMASAMTRCDALVTPTSTVAADPIARQPRGHGHQRWKNCAIFNLTGQPSISIPCGFTGAGMPVGLMISGRPMDDATVLRIAHAFERATPWHERRPTAFE